MCITRDTDIPNKRLLCVVTYRSCIHEGTGEPVGRIREVCSSFQRPMLK